MRRERNVVVEHELSGINNENPIVENMVRSDDGSLVTRNGYRVIGESGIVSEKIISCDISGIPVFVSESSGTSYIYKVIDDQVQLIDFVVDVIGDGFITPEFNGAFVKLDGSSWWFSLNSNLLYQLVDTVSEITSITSGTGTGGSIAIGNYGVATLIRYANGKRGAVGVNAYGEIDVPNNDSTITVSVDGVSGGFASNIEVYITLSGGTEYFYIGVIPSTGGSLDINSITLSDTVEIDSVDYLGLYGVPDLYVNDIYFFVNSNYIYWTNILEMYGMPGNRNSFSVEIVDIYSYKSNVLVFTYNSIYSLDGFGSGAIDTVANNVGIDKKNSVAISSVSAMLLSSSNNFYIINDGINRVVAPRIYDHVFSANRGSITCVDSFFWGGQYVSFIVTVDGFTTELVYSISYSEWYFFNRNMQYPIATPSNLYGFVEVSGSYLLSKYNTGYLDGQNRITSRILFTGNLTEIGGVYKLMQVFLTYTLVSSGTSDIFGYIFYPKNSSYTDISIPSSSVTSSGTWNQTTGVWEGSIESVELFNLNPYGGYNFLAKYFPILQTTVINLSLDIYEEITFHVGDNVLISHVVIGPLFDGSLKSFCIKVDGAETYSGVSGYESNATSIIDIGGYVSDIMVCIQSTYGGSSVRPAFLFNIFQETIVPGFLFRDFGDEVLEVFVNDNKSVSDIISEFSESVYHSGLSESITRTSISGDLDGLSSELVERKRPFSMIDTIDFYTKKASGSLFSVDEMFSKTYLNFSAGHIGDKRSYVTPSTQRELSGGGDYASTGSNQVVRLDAGESSGTQHIVDIVFDGYIKLIKIELVLVPKANTIILE